MSQRKRVNISLDPITYGKLKGIQVQHGFKNLCELVVACTHLLIDRVETAGRKRCDVPEDVESQVAEMFEELSYHQRTPDGTVPVRKHSKKLM